MIFNKSRGKVPEKNTVLLFIKQNYQLNSAGGKKRPFKSKENQNKSFRRGKDNEENTRLK